MSEINLITIEAIEREATALLLDLEEAVRSPSSIPGVPSSVDAIANAHARTMDRITRQLETKQISIDAFNRKAHDAISTNFEKAHRIGRGKALDAGDKLWLQGAVQTEMKFAGKFGNDIANNRMRMPRGKRAKMYSSAVRGNFWSAKVEAEGKKDPNVRITWKLACFTSNSLTVNTEHDCIPLKDVRVGDLVWTHKNRLRKVLAKPINKSTSEHSYAVLIGEGGKLVGLTSDHRLWTNEGWKTAKEVALGKNEKKENLLDHILYGLWESDLRCKEMLGLSFQKFERTKEKVVRGFDRFGFSSGTIREILCKLLDRNTLETCYAGKMDLGKAEWDNTERFNSSSQKRKSKRRQNRKFAVDEKGRTQQVASYGIKAGNQESELAWGKNKISLRNLWNCILQIFEQRKEKKILFGQMWRREGRENKCLSLRQLRERIYSKKFPYKNGRTKEYQKSFLLSELLEGTKGSTFDRDKAVWLLREEYNKNTVPIRRVEVGQVLLLKTMCEPGTALYDLVVEEDHSFVVEGMIVHNSAENCQDCLLLASMSPFNIRNLPTTPQSGGTLCRANCRCHLEFQSGPATRKEREDFNQYGNRKSETLSNMLSPGQPPKGLKLPNSAEQFLIDDLRNQINYNRRLIAQGNLSEAELKEAIFARKEANAQLIEFVDQNKIHEVPFWSVDDVIDGSHIGARAEADIFAAGIDSDSISELSKKEIDAILNRYKKEVGDSFAERATYVSPKIEEVEKTKEQIEKESFSRFRRGMGEYVLMGRTLKDTFELVGQVISSMADKPKLRMGPLRMGDAILAKTSVWLKGPQEQVDKVIENLKGNFVATPVHMARRKD